MAVHFISPKSANRLRGLVKPYSGQVQRVRSWRLLSDDDLWLKVLAQIAVVGRAAAGYTLERSVEARRQISVSRLGRFRTELQLQRHLHRILAVVGTRYVSRKGGWQRNRKAKAAVHNFRALMTAGGPKRFFQEVAHLPSENERIVSLQRQLKFYGPKGARDTLIELGLAKNCMALDVRIQGLLARTGASPPNPIDRHYEEIEQELIRKIARPLHLSGGELDRILFQNYDAILADIRLT